MTFIRMTPEDYLKSKIMPSTSTPNATLQIGQEAPTRQEKPILIFSRDEDRMVIYLGIIIISVLALLAITAILIKRSD